MPAAECQIGRYSNLSLPGGPIYNGSNASDQQHLARAKYLRQTLANFTSDLHGQGLAAYLATFELAAPPALLAKLNLTQGVDAPDLPEVAWCCEAIVHLSSYAFGHLSI